MKIKNDPSQSYFECRVDNVQATVLCHANVEGIDNEDLWLVIHEDKSQDGNIAIYKRSELLEYKNKLIKWLGNV